MLAMSKAEEEIRLHKVAQHMHELSEYRDHLIRQIPRNARTLQQLYANYGPADVEKHIGAVSQLGVVDRKLETLSAKRMYHGHTSEDEKEAIERFERLHATLKHKLSSLLAQPQNSLQDALVVQGMIAAGAKTTPRTIRQSRKRRPYYE
jgi:hypothetical protein